MKLSKTILIFLALAIAPLLASAQTVNGPVEFTWNPSGGAFQAGFPSPPIFFEYSSGTLANGVFTPTGLINSYFGNMETIDINIYFYTDTRIGPSFSVNGGVSPIATESFLYFESAWSVTFSNQTATVMEYGLPAGQQDTWTYQGSWTETGLPLPVPDASNSLTLFGVALGALGIFHAARRPQSSLS